MDLWRNGSASDSRSEGCVFDSRQVQFYFFSNYSIFILFFKILLKQNKTNSPSPKSVFSFFLTFLTFIITKLFVFSFNSPSILHIYHPSPKSPQNYQTPNVSKLTSHFSVSQQNHQTQCSKISPLTLSNPRPPHSPFIPHNITPTPSPSHNHVFHYPIVLFGTDP